MRDGVSNRQPHECLLNCLFRHRSKLRVTGLCEGNSPVTGEFPHKGPVTRKRVPFDDVIITMPQLRWLIESVEHLFTVLWLISNMNFELQMQLILPPPPPPTHTLNKMTAISQTLFSNAFSWMTSFVFWFKLSWSLFLRVRLAMRQHWLGAEQATSHYLNQCWHISLEYICDQFIDVIMCAMAPQMTGASIVYTIVGSGADQRKHQSSTPLAFVNGIHRWLVNS